ncbi:hypothetical protein QR680_003955 [Steinernema hermaphroditum]|uniref:DNA polymerase kappa n=1 Tax=Steinernema hermaphroditum TaxID=289476 RepID=A0AA39HPF0_9BILA|nr:hypothetical protein QR680_003955 [Steinernema hermaphroditum]
MLPFNDNKAGMTGLDKANIQKIISENTSANYEQHSRKQKERIDRRVEQNRKMLAGFTEPELTQAELEMDQYVEILELDRNLQRTAIHVDMDAFYAAVEMRDAPELRVVPMAVGGSDMLCTSNYIARKYGVRAAMPGFIAKKLCPQLKIVPTNFKKYTYVSGIVQGIFREYDPNLRMASLDEAYMDITDYLETRTQPATVKRVRYKGDCICRLPLIQDGDTIDEGTCTLTESKCKKCGKLRVSVEDEITFGTSAEDVVNEMRFRVEQATGLTCSAGIAVNWMLAKIGSDMNKPNGQYTVSGIGGVTEAILKGMGVEKCGDLYEKRGAIRLLFSELSWDWFMRVALGISNASNGKSEKESYRKSISVERTFQPQENIASLLQIIEGLCDELINSLSSHGIEGGRSATLKIKFASFDSITRCVSVDFLISTAEQFYPIIESTLKKECDGKVQVRLLGVRLSKLEFTDSKNANQSSKQRSMAEYLKAKKEPVDDEQDEPTPSTSSSSVGQCPICAKPLPVENSIAVNRHIDECLNRSALEEMPKNERKRKSSSDTKTVQSKKRGTILSYFGKPPEADGDIEIL